LLAIIALVDLVFQKYIAKSAILFHIVILMHYISIKIVSGHCCFKFVYQKIREHLTPHAELFPGTR